MKKIALVFASIVTAEVEESNMIFLKNETKLPLHYMVDCDRKLLTKTVKEIGGEIETEVKNINVGLTFNYSHEENYEYMFAKHGFTILPVGQSDKEPVAPQCETIYISIFTEKDNGEPPSLLFMNTKAMQKGDLLTLKENENSTPKWRQDKDVCGGYQCGCYNGYCWTDCAMGWCYSTLFLSQSFKYVTCQDDLECEPEWNCAGSCTV